MKQAAPSRKLVEDNDKCDEAEQVCFPRAEASSDGSMCQVREALVNTSIKVVSGAHGMHLSASRKVIESSGEKNKQKERQKRKGEKAAGVRALRQAEHEEEKDAP